MKYQTSFEKYGVNIMTADRLRMAILVLVVCVAGCSSEPDPASQAPQGMEADRLEIEATLEETAVRWRYGDKVILYEQEFEYIRDERTYDEYLEIDRIKKMESDTVVAFAVKDIQFFDRDSANVMVDVVFVGPSGDTTRLPQNWTMYYHQGHWIRPTLSSLKWQLEFEERVRRADSAAAAEEDEDW